METVTIINQYKIISAIGKGGMGEVWRARDTRLNREVAIKVLPAEFTQDAERARRFEQEARATSALNHPNILTVYDFGNYEANPYLVMELLDGEELRVQLGQGALPVRKAIEYAQQIAAGLAAAHEKGIVHRDLKPENLFITKDGRVKILDFGLAKLKPQKLTGGVDSEGETMKPLTNPGVVMGTVGYMSPEQVRGAEVDHRSDIFSFGIILHEMLSGQRTFAGDSLVELMNAILKEDPPELSETNAKIPLRSTRSCGAVWKRNRSDGFIRPMIWVLHWKHCRRLGTPASSRAILGKRLLRFQWATRKGSTRGRVRTQAASG
ncbi:MAG: serine/threonine protein kinase [Acidobacteria bacterium]|nr:serine/threonine protein kinase [Acidobacteriota bacterium]